MKRLTLWLISLSLLVGLGAIGSIWYLRNWGPLPDRPMALEATEQDFADVVRRIEAQGLTPEVEQAMGLVARRFQASGVYAVEDNGKGPFGSPAGRVEAAWPQQLVGSSDSTVLGRLRELERNRFGGYAGKPIARATTPDGIRYAIFLAYGSFAPASMVAAIYMVPTAALLAWLSLAVWIFFDARQRGLQAAGWGLLGALAGPLALAVWLIYRRNNHAEPVCAACGKDLVEEGLYCAHCGHPSRPGCPACRRPVQMDWHHCVACGTDLTG